MKKLSVIFLAVCLVSLSAFSAQKITVSGSIFNRSLKGDAPVGNLKLILVKMDKETGGHDHNFKALESTTTAEGKYVFENVQVQAGDIMSIAVGFDGVHYHSPDIIIEEGKNNYTLNTDVYSATEHSDHIIVKKHTMVIVEREGDYFVRENLVIANRGNSTFVGTTTDQNGVRKSLKFYIPPDYANLTLEQGLHDGYVLAGNGAIFDTLETKPGEREIVFYYSFPVKEVFEHTIYYPTEELVISLNNGDPQPQKNIELYSLERKEDKPLHNGFYYTFAGKELNSGTKVGFKLQSTKKDGMSPKTNRLSWGIAFFVGGVIALVIFIFIMKSSGGNRIEELKKLKEKLIVEIATLDDMNESEELDQEEYTRLRSARKKQLLQVSRELEKTDK